MTKMRSIGSLFRTTLVEAGLRAMHAAGFDAVPYYCSYKRVKGRSHTVEKRLNMHPHKPHATSQPSRLSHTYRPRAHSPHNLLTTVRLCRHARMSCQLVLLEFIMLLSGCVKSCCFFWVGLLWCYPEKAEPAQPHPGTTTMTNPAEDNCNQQCRHNKTNPNAIHQKDVIILHTTKPRAASPMHTTAASSG